MQRLQGEGGSEGTSPSAARPRKARKPRCGAGQTRRRGKLEELPDMPLDVLFEIFSHLEPIDLLHLARTSKAFRALLMSRRNAALWRAARRNIPDLPECPDDISEPALANLLFLSHCHGCGKPNTKRIFWDCAHRYCKNCEESVAKVSRWRSANLAHDALVHIQLIPEAKSIQLHELFKVFTNEDLQLFTSYYNEMFPILQHDVGAVSAVLADMTEEERVKYLQDLMARRRQWRDQMILIWKWHRARSVSRQEELDSIREARYASIWEKLEDLGWEEELNRLDENQLQQLGKLSFVCAPRPLTNRAWTNASPSILAFLENIKQERLRIEQHDRYRDRLLLFRAELGKVHNYRPGEPSELDVAFGIPRVRELIESPADVALDDTSFAFLRDAIPPFAAQWKRDALDALRRTARRALAPLPEDVDPLTLAAGQRFRCRTCGASADYREIVSHRCTLNAGAQNAGAFAEVALKTLVSVLWRPDDVNVCEDFWPVIRLCGLPAHAATLDALDRCKARFACETCDWVRAVKAMTWYSAVLHTQKPRYGRQCKLYVLPDGMARAARRMQRAFKEADADADNWKCLMCKHTTQTWVQGTAYATRRAVLAHLQKEHGVDAPVVDAHYREAGLKKLNPPPPDIHLISRKYRKQPPRSLQRKLAKGRAKFVVFPQEIRRRGRRGRVCSSDGDEESGVRFLDDVFPCPGGSGVGRRRGRSRAVLSGDDEEESGVRVPGAVVPVLGDCAEEGRRGRGRVPVSDEDEEESEVLVPGCHRVGGRRGRSRLILSDEEEPSS